ncbi:hypothetical protein [uncultured Treponema sp.]|uniref:hypothetical protein n=1 Tax=uncultured Treponema sp. TaxID=162155 RepID=UPI0015BBFAAF|nr:hypothetical protein [uncultured Treponema sp.]
MKKSFFYILSVLFFAGAVFFNSCKIVDGDDLKTDVFSLQAYIDKTEEGGTLDLSAVEGELETGSVEISRSITVTGGGEGSFDMKGAGITVNSSGVVLKNLKNLGSVVAGEKIGDGDFTLENCEGAGLEVNGGGENSIHLAGVNLKKLDIKKEDVRIVFDKNEDETAHSRVIDVKVFVSCRLDSEDSESVFQRVIVDKDVTKLTLDGKTAVSTLVVNVSNSDASKPVIFAASAELKILQGGFKNEDRNIKPLEFDLKAGVSAPDVEELTEEAAEAAESDIIELNREIPVGSVVVLSDGFEYKVTVNSFVTPSAVKGPVQGEEGFNTVYDTDFRATQYKEYDGITKYIELYRIPLAENRYRGTNGNAYLKDYFYVFDENLEKVAGIKYGWQSSSLFRIYPMTNAQACEVFDTCTEKQLRSIYPDQLNYSNFSKDLTKRKNIGTNFYVEKSSDWSEVVVNPKIVDRVSREKDYVQISENEIKSRWTLKQHFDSTGVLLYTEYSLRGMNGLGEIMPLKVYEPDEYGMTVCAISMKGNGFDNTDSDVYNSYTKIEALEDGMLRYRIFESVSGQTTYSQVWTEETEYGKKFGDGYVFKCPMPPGTPLKRYASVTFKKNSSGNYVPDINGFLNAYKTDFVELYKSDVWNNKDSLIASDTTSDLPVYEGGTEDKEDVSGVGETASTGTETGGTGGTEEEAGGTAV